MMTNVRYSRSNLLSSIREAILAGTSRNSEKVKALQILETEISSLIQEKMGNPRESFDSPYAHENENAHGKQLESSMLHRTNQTFGPLYCDGVYLSSCGHAVHERCLYDYLSSLTERVSDEEFLCPVCRGFANSVLPASLAPADPTTFTPSSSGAAEALTFQDALLCLRSAADIAGSKEVLQKLTSQHFGQGRKEYWPLVEVLRYSIISTEIMARSRNMDLTPDYSLRALYRELQSSNGVVLALLLRIVESTLTMDAFIVRFRWRVIVLLAESICWGSSLKEIRDEGCSFWRWCSDPILGRDAFSSLVYIVVCLPSCPGDTFLSMVQLLYAVAVTQMAQNESKISDTASVESTNIPVPKDLVSLSVSEENNKKRKGKELKADVWPHFERFTNANGIEKARCKYCAKVLGGNASWNGTTGLRRHLVICPKNPNKKMDDTSQKKLDSFTKGGKNNEDDGGEVWSFDQSVSRKLLVEMLIVDELPFCFVEKEGFKKFMRKTQPLFQIPSRRTVTRDCYACFGEEKEKLLKHFKETTPRICLTTDTWTSLQRINYMCLTAHFIDKDWVLHKRILNFCPVSSHKGVDMANSISKCFLDWHLEDIFTITVDNASSNDVTVENMYKQLTNWGRNMRCGNHLHIRCMAHILNLVVQDGMKEVGPSIQRIRHMVKYIRQSPARFKKFKDCCELQKVECQKSLCLDVPTRWNSTYLMLDTAQHFASTFERYDLMDKGLSAYLASCTLDDGKTFVGEIQCDDWINVKNMVKFLKKFYDLTVKVSGSLYVTCNTYFEEIVDLDVFLKESIEANDPNFSSMAKRMKEKFDKYWGDPEKMNKMLFIAAILDPRNNIGFVESGLEEMYGEEKGGKIKDEVLIYMKSLFQEYLEKNPDLSSRASSQLTSDSSSSCGIMKAKFRNKFEEKRRKANNDCLSETSELDKYLKEDLEVHSNDFDILLWWKVNAHRYKVLSEMARDVLAIPISSVASECAFSTGGRILDSFRSSLTPKLVQTLVCLQDWYRSEPLPVNVEEDYDDLLMLELGVVNSARDSQIVDV